MRVAHVCTRFSRPSETFIYDLIVGLERVGTENHVLTAARENAAQRPFSRVRLLPISPWRRVAFGIRKYGLGVYRFPLPLRAARRDLQDIRPDVVLAHFGGTGAAVAPAARELGIPLAVVFHAFDLFMRQFQPRTYAALWSSEARVVAVSEHGKRRLLDLGCPPERVRIIHCGVDLSRFKPAHQRPAGAHGLRLVSIGRLVEKKGMDDLLHALAAMRSRVREPIRLDIWGDGPLRRSLQRLAVRLGLQGVVAFRGAASNGDVPEILGGCDGFVLPSRTARNGDTEGIPITILEAQAVGLPVVSTLHGGIPEALPPANREWLAREGDVEDISRKLVSLALRPERWRDIGWRGREWVARHFSMRDEIAAYRRFLEETATLCP